MLTKLCTDCGKELPATEEYFHKHSKSKDGLRSKCKECRHIERAKYYSTHKEEAKIYDKIYNVLHGRPRKKKELDSKLFLEC